MGSKTSGYQAVMSGSTREFGENLAMKSLTVSPTTSNVVLCHLFAHLVSQNSPASWYGKIMSVCVTVRVCAIPHPGTSSHE